MHSGASGDHVWVVNDTLASDKVFRYTTDGVLEGSWSISTTNPSPTGITIDPNSVNHIWIVDATTDRVYQYDGATTRLAGNQDSSVTFALAATNTSPQGIAGPMPAPTASVLAPARLEYRVSRDDSIDRIMANLSDDATDKKRIRPEIEQSKSTNHIEKHLVHLHDSVANLASIDKLHAEALDHVFDDYFTTADSLLFGMFI